jgi:hypothetical protein
VEAYVDFVEVAFDNEDDATFVEVAYHEEASFEAHPVASSYEEDIHA